jgi:uncharacterized membrane protein YbaN (DUF454 family)
LRLEPPATSSLPGGLYRAWAFSCGRVPETKFNFTGPIEKGPIALEIGEESWHRIGSPERSRELQQNCPVDHEAAERTVDRLPGPLRRGAYFSIGSISVVLGVIGIFVPLWPTTCFLLLAGWCFARSSVKAERWLHENRLFGRYLSDYRERGVISGRVRTTSVATLWVFIGASTVFFLNRVWVVAILLLVAGAVTLHLYSLPTEQRIVRGE